MQKNLTESQAIINIKNTLPKTVVLATSRKYTPCLCYRMFVNPVNKKYLLVGISTIFNLDLLNQKIILKRLPYNKIMADQ